MKSTMVVTAVLCTLAGPAFAGDTSAEQSATAKWMIEQSRAWADQACGGKWVISDLLADDFHGTEERTALSRLDRYLAAAKRQVADHCSSGQPR